MLLEATSTMKVATGIANRYARDAHDHQRRHADPQRGAPGPVPAGSGRVATVTWWRVSASTSTPSRTRRWSSTSTPWTSALFMAPKGEPPAQMVLAALGPKMLRLAAERTAGAHPYFVPPEHTVDRPRDHGSGAPAGGGADGGARRRPRVSPRHRAGPHGDLSRAAQLRQQPEAARFHRGGDHPGRRVRPAGRRHRRLGRRGARPWHGCRPTSMPVRTTSACRCSSPDMAAVPRAGMGGAGRGAAASVPDTAWLARRLGHDDSADRSAARSGGWSRRLACGQAGEALGTGRLARASRPRRRSDATTITSAIPASPNSTRRPDEGDHGPAPEDLVRLTSTRTGSARRLRRCRSGSGSSCSGSTSRVTSTVGASGCRRSCGHETRRGPIPGRANSTVASSSDSVDSATRVACQDPVALDDQFLAGVVDVGAARQLRCRPGVRAVVEGAASRSAAQRPPLRAPRRR